MDPDSVIHTVSCHAAGEVGDVIVDGVAPPPGESIWEQSRWIATDQRLRNYLLNEPRGGVFRHVNLLVPARAPEADIGFIIMEPIHSPPMSGSNAMCVATVVLETGIVEMIEPITDLVLEAPAGLVPVTATCRDGRVEAVTLTNVASFADRLDARIEVDGIGSLRVDTAFGGDSFVLVDAADLGFAIEPSEAADLVAVGRRIAEAANEQLGFRYPTEDLEWNHISFCQIAGPLERVDGTLTQRSTTLVEPGKLDRSPTGTAVSARLAMLAARGLAAPGDALVMRSIIDSTFVGTIVDTTTVGDRPAVIATVTGSAWITGTHQYRLDPADPWPAGYRVADTWPMPNTR